MVIPTKDITIEVSAANYDEFLEFLEYEVQPSNSYAIPGDRLFSLATAMRQRQKASQRRERKIRAAKKGL